MSRYPGTTFQVIDNSNVTAAVPISTKNPAAPTYLAAFRSCKGPEMISTTYGQEFYDMYGDQSKILFNKYGQPLLQASMDINAGAQLIAKRVVLDDATLANATVGLIVSKQKSVTAELKDVTVGTPAVKKKGIGTVTLGDARIVLTPIVMSYDNSGNGTPDISDSEKKFLYSEYKKRIIEAIEGGIDNSLISIKGNFAFTATQKSAEEGKTDYIAAGANVVFADTEEYSNDTNGNNKIGIGGWSKFKKFEAAPTGTVTAMEDTYTTEAEYNKAIKATVASIAKAAIYDSKVYFFPLFTIFDNGRGDSQKSISITFDSNTSKTLGKAVYALKVFNLDTNKQLEAFSFTVDPYCRNTNTGYTFDIESAVNYTSKQISTKFYHDSYDVLVDLLMDEAKCPSSIFETSDCLFGHNLDGRYIPTGKQILSVSGKPMEFVDYTDLHVSGEYNISVNVASEIGNMTDYKDSDKIRYYYYNYPTRAKMGLTEKLEFGNDGGKDLTTKEALEAAYNEKYYDFFSGDFDHDIFNLDVYFPNALFDANFNNKTKLAIQRLAAYRGDFVAFMDMRTSVNSFSSVKTMIPAVTAGTTFLTDKDRLEQPYIRDMHIYVTSLYGDIKDPYTNRQITVTGTYDLSIVFVNYYISKLGSVFAGKSNGVMATDFINGTVNYIPKIYPTSAMTTLSNIGMQYPSDDDTITNEKQLMCDLRVNYGSYYDDLFVKNFDITNEEKELAEMLAY